MKTELPILLFETSQHFEDWLKTNHARSLGIWLQLAKKGADTTTVSYADALDVALCYGWIDGQKQAQDVQFWWQKFTPRRRKSVWSKVNTQKALALIEQGRMQQAGLREIEAAKQDGRWAAAYEPSSRSTVPDDFQEALDKSPKAKAFFATRNKQNQYAMTYRIQSAKKAETRRKRIEQFIATLN
jgi:uncharacterized protein YdeI (YjbR/CyaY-like superfamily)